MAASSSHSTPRVPGSCRRRRWGAGLGPRRGRRRAALHLLLERVHLVLQLQVLGLDALQLELELAVRLLISSGHHLHGSIDRKNEEAISSSSSSQGD